MKRPLQLAKAVKVSRGPVFLGQPVVSTAGIVCGVDDLYCLETDDLKLIWSCRHDEFSPVLACGDVVVLSNLSHRLQAIDAASGEVRWARQSRGGLLWQEHLLTFTSSGIELVEPSSGRVLDTHEILHIVRPYDVQASVLFYAKHNIGTAESGDKLVAAYDLVSRQALWERDIVQEMRRNYGLNAPGFALRPGGEGQFVVSRSGAAVFGCSMEDGRILWHAPVGIPYHVPNVHNGRVYALTEARLETRARLVCIDAGTGESIYEVEHKELRPADQASRGTLWGGFLAFGTRAGLVPVFRLSDGSLALSYRHKKGEAWQPATASDRLLVTTGDGQLLVFQGSSS